MKKSNIAVLSFGLLVALVAPASAGQSSSPPAYCVRNSDGSGYCTGTFRGFRNATGSSYAQFTAYPTTLLSFYGRYGTTSVSCYRSVSSSTDEIGSGMIQRWPMGAPADTYFEIDWDSSGKCTYFFSGTHSNYLP